MSKKLEKSKKSRNVEGNRKNGRKLNRSNNIEKDEGIRK